MKIHPAYAINAILAIVLVAANGCLPASPPAAGGNASTSSEKTLSILCTTGQVGDLLTHLGGEHVKVETLMGPGVDPHLYRGTLADTQKLNRADAVFYNGLHLEGRSWSLWRAWRNASRYSQLQRRS